LGHCGGSLGDFDGQRLASCIGSFSHVRFLGHYGKSRDGKRGEDQKMFRYYSVYGIPMGSWEDIQPNAAVVALDEQQSVRQTSYGGTKRYQESQECVLYLVNVAHREKVKIAKVSSRAELDPYLPILENEFNLKLVKFSPAVSAKTSARRRNRR
jgi:hypothetical protein